MAPTLRSTRKRRQDWPRCCGYGGRRWVWLDVGSGLELIRSYSGSNDAPALTAADVGIAVASGSDVAISSASFILLTSDLRSLVTLRDLARTTSYHLLWLLMRKSGRKSFDAHTTQAAIARLLPFTNEARHCSRTRQICKVWNQ